MLYFCRKELFLTRIERGIFLRWSELIEMQTTHTTMLLEAI